VAQAANYVGCSELFIRKQYQTKALEIVRVSSRKILIRQSALEAYLQRQTTLVAVA